MYLPAAESSKMIAYTTIDTWSDPAISVCDWKFTPVMRNLALTALLLRWRDTKINDIHDFTGYCYFHDKTELYGCILHSVLLALSLGPD